MHQPPHAAKLADLLGVTPGPGLGHHVEGVEGVVLLKVLEDRPGDLLRGFGPELDHLVVALPVGEEAHLVGLLDLPKLLVGFLQVLLLLGGDDGVVDADGDPAGGGKGEAVVLEGIQKPCGLLNAQAQEGLVDQVF